MNILWLTNIPVPEASLLMNEKPLSIGGWLDNASLALSERDSIKLSLAFPKRGLNEIKLFNGNKIAYGAFPFINDTCLNSINQNKYLSAIIDKTKPDIVHIFGTEFVNTLAMINVCKIKNIKTIVSIQGLVSVYAKHYMANLPIDIQKRFTFRDFIKQDNLIQQKNEFVKRGKFEIEAIKNVAHIIGRTTWDKACALQINPNMKYHYCNETLRDVFYKYLWDINKCEKYSIFMSQASYPIKGLHYMLEAMPEILKRFPDTKLYIAGADITRANTLIEKLKKTSYAKYIIELIRKLGLKDKVIFTGTLNEKLMCERYLKSNVFVCPSSIENSPNSLGEAMILGLPCVASDVGGVSDLLKHKDEGFVYQADAPYMLAYYVCEIFDNEKLMLEFSNKARKHALKIHDKEDNARRLVEIYNLIEMKKA